MNDNLIPGQGAEAGAANVRAGYRNGNMSNLRNWVDIDLEAIRDNARTLKSLVGPGKLYMACVKGNGYGHGMIPVARAALEGGADRLSVAHVEEGIELRRRGIEAPIQLLIEPTADSAKSIYKYGLIPSLSSHRLAKELAACLPGRIKVHVEIDTGMGRVSLKPEDAPGFLDFLDSLKVFEVEGIYSHFVASHIPNDDKSRACTLNQLEIFLKACLACQSGGRFIALKHIASSGGVALYPESYLDMIRPGFLLYGIPTDWVKIPLNPALSWMSRVRSVLPISKGQSLGYERSFIAESDTRIAVVDCGYADGYPRLLSNLSKVLIRGSKAPVIGLVGMNQFSVDVGHIPEVDVDDEVVLVGSQMGKTLPATEMAIALKTTPAIIPCAISQAVPKHYLNRRD